MAVGDRLDREDQKSRLTERGREMQCILVHGLGQTGESWGNTVQAVRTGADIVCPELAQLVSGNEVDYPRLYKAFSGYCGSFEGPLHLCGLSLGGILALHYGIDHPDRTASLVLIGARYRMPQKLLKLQNTLLRLTPSSKFASGGFKKADFLSLSASMASLDFSGSLQKISCPAMVLCGERDRANRKASIDLSQRLRSAEFHAVSGAGHEVNLDEPGQLAGLLDAFYRKLSR